MEKQFKNREIESVFSVHTGNGVTYTIVEKIFNPKNKRWITITFEKDSNIFDYMIEEFTKRYDMRITDINFKFNSISFEEVI